MGHSISNQQMPHALRSRILLTFLDMAILLCMVCITFCVKFAAVLFWAISSTPYVFRALYPCAWSEYHRVQFYMERSSNSESR